jgi:type II restriction/modification system DNA methylase subunit YeeA
MGIIDFGVDMPLEVAVLYEHPFQYVEQYVKPKYGQTRSKWWLHERPRPDMRKALSSIDRYIVTPRVAKHRTFGFVPTVTLPDSQVIAIARDDDYFLGVLQSKLHELWTLKMCTWLGVGNDPRYTPTTTFETYPFPWPPGREPKDDPRVDAIAEAARELVEKRDRWLNPEGATEAELKKRTLTNLYNQRPTWLQLAHEKLDRAVLDAYGWPHDIGDEEILARLLALNLERASAKDRGND